MRAHTLQNKREAKERSEGGNVVDALTMVGTRVSAGPEILRGDRYNEAVDTYSFALVLLCLYLGSINYVSDWYSHDVGIRARPPIPSSVSETDVAALIQEMWCDDFRKRPRLHTVLARLRKEGLPEVRIRDGLVT